MIIGVTQMTIEAAILKNIENLPESVKYAVFLYTEFLNSQYSLQQTEQPKITPKKYRSAGLMEGMIIMSDDFDEPLEDLKDYM